MSSVGSSLELMHRFDRELAHVWMVRTFLKHSEEAAEDDELAEVHRELYDFMLALGPSFSAEDFAEYFRIVRKKFTKFKHAIELFNEIQPEVSGHMNFQMARKSLNDSPVTLEAMLQS